MDTSNKSNLINIMINKEDINDFEKLILLSRINPSNKTILKNLYTKYINKNGAICMSCDAQVRIAFEKLKKYYNKNI